MKGRVATPILLLRFASASLLVLCHVYLNHFFIFSNSNSLFVLCFI